MSDIIAETSLPAYLNGLPTSAHIMYEFQKETDQLGSSALVGSPSYANYIQTAAKVVFSCAEATELNRMRI